MIIEMLNNGAKLNKRDAHGRVPLHWAAQSGHLSTVKGLIKASRKYCQKMGK
ncbi:MAG: hypothetical protein KC505_08480 [Myxococcales bacterium]|nr:hypothetical protein [Myxococcales bacterium]USN50940.1 MAG: hypothetical protein H6731_00545 [Myxococcales bacterium]